MRKMLMVILLAIMNGVAFTQPFHNEWIDYSKTYYKFSVSANGLYRISQSQLSALGLGGTNAQDFKMWRNGVEVPLYTSVTSGPLGANGYIEFYGKFNDGTLDTELYPDPFYQPSTSYSLFSGVASYFLTVNAATSNARITNMANNVNPSETPEPYCMYSAEKTFADQLWGGNASYVQGEYVRSATFDKGEGFQSNPFTYTDVSFPDLKAYTSGPSMKLYTKGAGAFVGGRRVLSNINGSLIDSTYSYSFDNFEINHTNLSTSYVRGDAVSLSYYTNGSGSVMLSYVSLTYPRRFDFDGMSQVAFTLPANSNGSYLQINNFNSDGSEPVLYDLSNNTRYVCQQAGTVLRVKLQASVYEHNFILLSTASIGTVSTITPRNFVDYSNTANQGNYLIISNALLNSGTQAYSNYRSSAAGGGFNTRIIDIDEITDQFAYGISKHPLSIRNFLRYARSRFTSAPKFALLIGHGINYLDYSNNASRPSRELLNLVPTWGHPGSDNLLGAGNNTSPIVLTPVGRISVINNLELQNYLSKVVEFEQLQVTSSHDQAGENWKKQVLHLIGASDAQTGDLILPMMNTYKSIIEDTLVGANVHTYVKANNPNLTQSTSEVANLINNGVPLLTYFGHSSATSLDFNLNNPADYTNSNGKYPVFIANGCNAGSFFDYDENRLTGLTYTISEKFLLAPSSGSIAFIASTHFGVLNTLDYVTNAWYRAATKTAYGKSLGEIQQSAIQSAWNNYSGDYYTKLTLEETTINGDPALKVFSLPLPDFSLEQSNVTLTPSFISAADDSFRVKTVIYNLGKAVNDSVTIKIERRLPDGSTRLIALKKLKGIRSNDSIQLSIPIVGNLEKGTNQIIATIDPQSLISESSEANNVTVKDFEISDDEIRPVYPYSYSIVNTPSFKLTGSTVDPFETQRTYRMQMDTTEYFNSGLLYTSEVFSKGGVVEFAPMDGLQNGTVYYWRLAPVINGEATNWRSASFLYSAGSTAGWNQSHVQQHLKSTYSRMMLDPVSRTYQYNNRTNNLFIAHSKYPQSGTEDSHFSISVNGDMKIASACVGASVIFNVFDTLTLQPWKNTTGMYGSAINCNNTTRSYNFEYSYQTPDSRKKMMDFMNAIPDGYYVAARLILDVTYNPNTGGYDYFNSFAETWKADEAIYGSGQSLYHYLQAQGAQLDNINDPNGRIWAFVYRKNAQARFAPKFYYSPTIYDRITASIDCPTVDTLGYVTSPKFGPARSWQNVHWHGHSVESSNSPDKVLLSVIGVDNAGNETELPIPNSAAADFSIASINTSQYPYIRLKLRDQDAVNASPWQLDDWRVDYVPVPEGAVAPNLYFAGADVTINQELQQSKYPFSVAFKNVSNVAFDSIKLKVVLTDSLGVSRVVAFPKAKPINAGDTANIYFELNTDGLAGTYNMMVDLNPDNDQKEQYHFNNFIYKSLLVIRTDDIGICPGSSTTYNAGQAAGAYQWQVDAGSGFVNISDNAVFSGATTENLKLTAPPTSWYGYKFRCVMNGGGYSEEKVLKYAVKWNGTVSTEWENTGNWSCGVLPDENTDVIVNSSLSRYPVVNSNGACRSLKAMPNATIRITAGNSLNVTGKGN